jgi:hypothetical protein
MEFIGISGKENEVDVNSIISIANGHNIDTVKNKWGYDGEVSVGLKYFTDTVNDDFLLQLILKNKEGRQTTTSNFLTEELNEFYIHNARSTFIEFIRSLREAHLQIKSMHIIFASEWENTTQSVRYIKTKLSDIEGYFKFNNGWHLIFYSLKTKSYMYEFECPLIFEIQV